MFGLARYLPLLVIIGCSAVPVARSPEPVFERLPVVQRARDASPSPDPRRRAARVAIDTLAPAAALSPGFEDEVFRALSAPGMPRLVPSARDAKAVDKVRRRHGASPLTLGVPMVESRFRTDLVSPGCAAGPWQLLPETARTLGLEVSGCVLAGEEDAWTPESGAVPSRFSGYRSDGACRIVSCAVDERKDLARSSDAALRYLLDAGSSRAARAHPQRDLLQLMAYNAGPARMSWWVEEHPDDPIGALAACAGSECGLAAEHARFPARVVAGAALVACGALGDAGWTGTPLCDAMATAGLSPEPASELRLVDEAWPSRVVEDGNVAWVELTRGDRTAVAPLVTDADRAREVAARDLVLGTYEGASALAVRWVDQQGARLAPCRGQVAASVAVGVSFEDGRLVADGDGCVASAIDGMPSPRALNGAVVAVSVHLPPA